MKKLIKNINYGKLLHTGFLIAIFLAMTITPVFAADMWDKASEIMRSVYTEILGISTAAGIVCSTVALLLMNFSKNGKTVDESRTWLKRIVISWVILNSLGFIMSYISPFFTGGKWGG